MREIKFRAWDKAKGKMVFPTEFGFGGLSTSHGLPGPLLAIRFYDPDQRALLASEIELMQYTGLKDKNGKEIYEGDIVRVFPVWDGMEEFTAAVQFEDGGFYPLCEYEFSPKVEVIGNIHENRELCGTH